MVLRSERIVTPSGTVAGEVAIEDGRITAVSPDTGQHPEALQVGQRWLVPGYIDTHVHGGGGAQCNTADPDEIAAVASFHAEHGTTALLATTVAAPVEELIDALGAITRCVGARGGATVLGAHLEGPFLSPAQPGAMEPTMFTAPDRSILERLLTAGNGTVRMMTLAPELPGAVELVRALVQNRVVSSLGHSDASYAETLAAVRAGLTPPPICSTGCGRFTIASPASSALRSTCPRSAAS